jgi:hypothetical protein
MDDSRFGQILIKILSSLQGTGPIKITLEEPVITTAKEKARIRWGLDKYETQKE